MLNVRIFSIKKNNNPLADPICFDLPDNCIAGADGSLKWEFAKVITGIEKFEGDNILNYVSQKGDTASFENEISVFIRKEQDTVTTISVNDYVELYGIGSDEDYGKWLMQELSLINYFRCPVKELPAWAQSRLGILRALQKNASLVILNDFFLQEDVGGFSRIWDLFR